MQSKIYRYLYPNVLLRSLSQLLPVTSIMDNSVSHFSTIPNRPMRGDRRRRRRNDDPSEERQFLRNLNFGDTNDHEKPHSSRPTRTEQRPPRGIRKEREGDVRELDESFKVDLDKGGKLSFGNTSAGLQTEQRPLRRTDREGEDDDEIADDGDALLGKLDFADISRGNRKEQRPTRDRGLNGKLDFSGIGVRTNAEEARESRTSATETAVAESAVEDSEEIFKKMKETGLIPNAVSMLDGLCKDGLVQEAMKLFGAMREKGTIPEVVIYTAVVEGFCRAAKFDDAKRIFRKMQKNEIVPNAFSYGVLIQGLIRGKKLEDAVEFCMEMLDAGHVPNAATLASLVDGLCREKGAEEAEGLVRSLKERGFVIDEKAVREHLDKKGGYSPMAWEAIFGKDSKRPF